MSVMIEQDLKEYLDQKFSSFERRFEEKFEKIDQRFDKIDERLERIENEITDLKIGQVRLEGELKGELKRIEEKIDGLDKRLDFQEFIRPMSETTKNCHSERERRISQILRYTAFREL